MTYRVRPALECCHICPNQDTGESEATLQLSSPGIHPFNFETGIRVLHCNYWLQILVTLVISTWTKPDAKSVTTCSTTFVWQFGWHPCLLLSFILFFCLCRFKSSFFVHLFTVSLAEVLKRNKDKDMCSTLCFKMTVFAVWGSKIQGGEVLCSRIKH